VVMERLEPGRQSVVFHSKSGPLVVTRVNAGYVLNFPARPSEKAAAVPPGFAHALGVEPVEVWVNAFNYMAVLDSASTVRSLTPDMAAIARLDRPGVIVTAAGDEAYDCVSRYFAPAKGVPEDPVTGAAHCMLVPYWAPRLGKTELRAYQASKRGGEITCRAVGERVELEGQCLIPPVAMSMVMLPEILTSVSPILNWPLPLAGSASSGSGCGAGLAMR
ncbi:MAG: PhzF family phenazine biosynthesis protein, partial [Mesorhizobium sp.]